MSGFTAARARLYLVAFSVWAGTWAVVVFRFGGGEVASGAAVGLLLAAMFPACGVTCAIAWLLTRDEEPAPLLPGTTPGSDLVRLGLLWAMRCWLLLLGGGLPAALRVLR